MKKIIRFTLKIIDFLIKPFGLEIPKYDIKRDPSRWANRRWFDD